MIKNFILDGILVSVNKQECEYILKYILLYQFRKLQDFFHKYFRDSCQSKRKEEKKTEHDLISWITFLFGNLTGSIEAKG